MNGLEKKTVLKQKKSCEKHSLEAVQEKYHKIGV